MLCPYPSYKFFRDHTGEYIKNPCWPTCQGHDERKTKRKRGPKKDIERDTFLQSDEWKEIVRQVRERDGWQCVECGTTDKLSTHHIDFSKYNNDLDNLVTLCWTHHSKRHHGKKVDDL